MQALIQELLAYTRAGVAGEPVRVNSAELVRSVDDAGRQSRPSALFEVEPTPVLTTEPAPLRQVFSLTGHPASP